MYRILAHCATAALGLCMASSVAAAERPPLEELGRSVKLTILVDKVMQPEADWVTEEWMVRATAEAGFNVFSPRRGHELLDEVRQVNEWCDAYGIYHMPWMRGTLAAPTGAEAEGKRLVWADGGEQPLWSPNSDEFWEWTARYIVEYARLSAEDETLMGVFLDYENYAPGPRQGNCYSLSYDDIILSSLATATGIDLPDLAPDERKPWLEEQGLHDRFAEFQIAHWRERCRALREAVDEHNPAFMFCIYPAPGTPFMVEACYPEWATEAAPLILADASVYGRPSRFLPQAEALEANRRKLTERMGVPTEAGINFIYAGGIDPVVTGADPEFSGKNAVTISEATDGYWIFYEGPVYTEQSHRDYWKWFTWANRAIAESRFEAQHEARETPEDWSLDVFTAAGEQPALVPPEVTGESVEFPLVRLRNDNMLVLACRGGQPVRVTLRNHPVARYESLLIWDLRDGRLEKIATGTIPHDESGIVEFTPEADGVYLLGASAGSCAYSVVDANVPVGFYAAAGLKLIYGAGLLHFTVPEGVDEFVLRAAGWGGETVRINVLDPDGDLVATGQTTAADTDLDLTVPVGDRQPGTWSLEATRADGGVLEDCTIALDAKLPPVLSLASEHVFGVVPGG